MEKALKEKKTLKCGIIMPISEIDDYTVGHWIEVKDMIKRATNMVSEYDIKSSLVSDADESHIIHSTIMKNLYFDDIVVCDVSAKNPNVMFELGLRMAFGKPVIIIKDDKTTYSFDTGNIEHIDYRADMSYNSVDLFHKKLADKIISTYKDSLDEQYVPFIMQFGNFELEMLPTNKISAESYLLEINNKNDEILSEIKKLISNNQGLNKEQLGEQFIESYIENNKIDSNKLIGHIDSIVKSATQDKNILSLFSNTEDLEKFIANLILTKLWVFSLKKRFHKKPLF